MTCVIHAEREAAAYCRNCGRALCPECKRDVRGTVFCEDCLVAQLKGQAPASDRPSPGNYAAEWLRKEGPSPGLAMFLGLIPGVGAIYNGQFAKAFLHVMTFAMLCTLADMNEIRPFQGLFVGLAIFFIPYMAGEAYHTARKRKLGMPVDEWSGLLPAGTGLSGAGGAMLLIVVGVVFLMDTMGIVPLGQVVRFWPVLLIIVGALMLMQKLGAKPSERERGGFGSPPE